MRPGQLCSPSFPQVPPLPAHSLRVPFLQPLHGADPASGAPHALRSAAGGRNLPSLKEMRAGAPCPCTSASSPGFLRVLLAGGVVSPLLCGGIPCPRLLCWAAPPALGSHRQDSSGAGAGSPRRSAPHRASHEALGRSSQPGGAEGGKERTGGGGRGGLGAGLRAVPAPPRGGAHSSGGGGGGAMVKIGVQQPPAALKPEQEKEKAAGGDGAPGAVLLPPGTVSAGSRGGLRGAGGGGWPRERFAVRGPPPLGRSGSDLRPSRVWGLLRGAR